MDSVEYLIKCSVCAIKAHTKEDLNLFVKDKRRKYNRKKTCKRCANANRRAHHSTERERRYKFKSKYNISIEDYGKMLQKQQGRCLICADVFSSTPHVDHDHSTGKVRGLLCMACNTGLGQFKDSTEYLEQAIKYLEGRTHVDVREEKKRWVG